MLNEGTKLAIYRRSMITISEIPIKNNYSSQEAYPVKVKEVHVINVSPLVDTIINFVKPILKEKLRERVRSQSSSLFPDKYVR